MPLVRNSNNCNSKVMKMLSSGNAFRQKPIYLSTQSITCFMLGSKEIVCLNLGFNAYPPPLRKLQATQ